MTRLYILLVFILFSGSVFAQAEAVNNSRGYIVTLSGDHLTGRIGDVIEGNGTSFVMFINDFGTPYMIRAELIRGFAFKENKDMLEYETQFDSRKWLFMKVIVRGAGISLYKSPGYNITNQSSGSVNVINNRNFQPGRYYIVRGDRNPIPVKRWGFRRNMRKILKERAPEVASKIGDKGYRFKNLEKIIKEYNREYILTRYSL